MKSISSELFYYFHKREISYSFYSIVNEKKNILVRPWEYYRLHVYTHITKEQRPLWSTCRPEETHDLDPEWIWHWQVCMSLVWWTCHNRQNVWQNVSLLSQMVIECSPEPQPGNYLLCSVQQCHIITIVSTVWATSGLLDGNHKKKASVNRKVF